MQLSMDAISSVINVPRVGLNRRGSAAEAAAVCCVGCAIPIAFLSNDRTQTNNRLRANNHLRKTAAYEEQPSSKNCHLRRSTFFEQTTTYKEQSSTKGNRLRRTAIYECILGSFGSFVQPIRKSVRKRRFSEFAPGCIRQIQVFGLKTIAQKDCSQRFPSSNFSVKVKGRPKTAI